MLESVPGINQCTKQWELSFLLKETTGAFDGARTRDWRVSNDHESDALPTGIHRSRVRRATHAACYMYMYYKVKFCYYNH